MELYMVLIKILAILLINMGIGIAAIKLLGEEYYAWAMTAPNLFWRFITFQLWFVVIGMWAYEIIKHSIIK